MGGNALTAPLTQEQIKTALTMQGGRIVWAARTADFYASSFSKAYDPEGAARYWNKNSAGKAPAWRYDKIKADFTCTALLRQLSLKAACAALGISYEQQTLTVAQEQKDKREDTARDVVLRCVELSGGVPVWRTRTRDSHPKTSQSVLDDFNSRYAGKQVRPRKGVYKISYNQVSEAQLRAWLEEKP
jgi:hypothetical protein